MWASKALEQKSEPNLGFSSSQGSIWDIAVLCKFWILKSDSSNLGASGAALVEVGGQPSSVRTPLPLS